jgi:PAS domain S-box-containing protein
MPRATAEKWWHSMMDDAPTMVWTCAANRLCDWLNLPWLAFTGRTMEDSLGLGWAKDIHRDDYDRVFEVFNAAFAKREKFAVEFRLRRHDGQYRWVIDHGQPRYFNDEFVGYMGSCLEIHAQMEHKHALEWSEWRYRTLAQNFPLGGAALFDKNLRYILVDGSEFAEGWSKETMEGRTIFEIAGHGRRAEIDDVAEVYRMVLKGETFSTVSHEGDKYWRIAAGPVREGNGEIINGVIMWRDVTEDYQHAQEKELLLAQAKQALATRDTFMSVAAHELKTPLTSMLGFAQIVKMRAKDVLDNRDMMALSTSIRQADRLNQMINALLDVTRIAQGRLEIAPRMFDIVGMIRLLAGEMQITTDLHRVMVDENSPESLPVCADIDRMEQVIRNLLANAIKYSPDGGDILVSIHDVGDHVTIFVHDCGLGIPPGDEETIFQQYYRASNLGPTVNTQISGLGIGLYVSRQIVELHGGTLTARSRQNDRGSTFIITLPKGQTDGQQPVVVRTTAREPRTLRRTDQRHGVRHP